ncbi:hypothetical protein C7212DRAFT_351385 [Tuber magnatum]|uniref:ARM repeat-containing protein n=1 Tax=Tuber magnatum TaxID=42249 RepID=A0A317SUU1_9PEZI|nr:hypothetical protein C7212DRAFT_351385 [Tuber magnatum]
MLHGMVKVPGYPVAEEEISGTTFEFWSSLAEFLLDPENVAESDIPSLIAAGKKEIMQAIEEFWTKIQIPPHTESLKWTKDLRDGFTSFRKDVADLVEVAYGILGLELFDRLISQVISALANSQAGGAVAWEQIEASLFCLNSLSDCLGDEPEEDESLKVLFRSRLFNILADFGNQIPLRVRQTAVHMIGSYAVFFERWANFLPTVLNFLFVAISTPALARNASKSISSLCSSCRSTLTSELSVFLYQYELFSATPTADDIAKERVLCAISYVIQALPSESQKLDSLGRILGYVDKDAQQFLTILPQHPEAAKELGVSTLQCLVAIGKGLQAPDDIPIILAGEGGGQGPPSFWEQESGLAIQRRILHIIQTLVGSLAEDGEMIDAACAVFRTGFAETAPGPFVFPPRVVTEFLLERANRGVRVETVLSTASTMVSSHSLDGSPDISTEVGFFLELILGLAERLQNPQEDPEMSQGLVEFINRLFSRYITVIVHYQPRERIEMLLWFVMNALQVRETLVKKAACTFWASLVSFAADDRPELQASINSFVHLCGPALAEKLVWGIGGGASRSEVDSLTEPLKKMIARQVKAKTWLSASLSRNGFPSPNLSEKDKTVFLNKIMTLRGKRGTNQIAKEFWLSSRGSDFAC